MFSPFFLPVVSPRCVSPFLGRSPRARLSATWIYSSTIWDVTYPRNNFVLRCAFLVSLGHPLFERKQDETLGRQTPQESFHLRKKSKKENTWKIKKENFKTLKKRQQNKWEKKERQKGENGKTWICPFAFSFHLCCFLELFFVFFAFYFAFLFFCLLLLFFFFFKC